MVLVALREGVASGIGAPAIKARDKRRLASLDALVAAAPNASPQRLDVARVRVATVRVSLCGGRTSAFEMHELRPPCDANGQPRCGLQPAALQDARLRFAVVLAPTPDSPALLELAAFFSPSVSEALPIAFALLLPWRDAAQFVLHAAMHQLPAARHLFAPLPPSEDEDGDLDDAAPPAAACASFVPVGEPQAYGWHLGRMRRKKQSLRLKLHKPPQPVRASLAGLDEQDPHEHDHEHDAHSRAKVGTPTNGAGAASTPHVIPLLSPRFSPHSGVVSALPRSHADALPTLSLGAPAPQSPPALRDRLSSSAGRALRRPKPSLGIVAREEDGEDEDDDDEDEDEGIERWEGEGDDVEEDEE